MHLLDKEGNLICFFNETLNQGSIDELCKNILDFSNTETDKKIRININSYGGSVKNLFDVFSVVNAVKEKGVIVETQSDGIAGSSASLMLAMGSRGHRYITPQGSVMVHMPFLSSENATEEDEKYLESVKSRFLNLTANLTGKRLFHVEQLLANQKYLTPEEAISEGFCDKIKEIVAFNENAEKIEENQEKLKIQPKTKMEDTKLQEDYAKKIADLEKAVADTRAYAEAVQKDFEQKKVAEVMAMGEELFLKHGLDEAEKNMVIAMGKAEGISSMIKLAEKVAKPKAGVLTEKFGDKKEEPKELSFVDKIVACDLSKESDFLKVSEMMQSASIEQKKELLEKNPTIYGQIILKTHKI